MTVVVVTVMLVISLTLIVGRSWTALAGLVVFAGLIQIPLIATLQTNAVQLLDDVPAMMLILAGLVRLVTSSERRDHLAFVAGILTGIVVAYAAVRSPDLGVGIAQARQVLIPVGLVLAGFAFRSLIQWRRLWNVVLLAALVTAAWMALEELRQAPLIDPVWYYTQVIGGAHITLRNGLPPAYYSDVPGGVIFRPGGPYMNPPVAGFMLGAGAYAAMRNLRGGGRVFALLLIGSALVMSTARAGIVIFALVTVVYWGWNKLGRFAAVVITAMFAGYALTVFIEQGNTASHTEGLFSGIATALTNPLGLGFGVTGYQASLEGAGIGAGSESLLGLYFSWLGVPALAAVVFVVVMLIRVLAYLPRQDSLPAWAAIAMVTTAAVSESASSVAATPALWLAVGYALTLTPHRTPRTRGHAPSEPRGHTGGVFISR